MTTYLVRTRIDRALVGVFCASSQSMLAKVIAPLVDARECEYLVLKANEGLFVEAQFVKVPATSPGEPSRVYLTNSPADFIEPAPAEGSQEEPGDIEAICTQEGMLKEALEEEIPPVLEPTEALAERLHCAEFTAWHPFSSLPKATRARPPVTRTPILILTGGSTRQH